MKKHIVTALLAIVMCLAMLCGCSAVKVFERDVQVILKVDGEYRGCYTVNIFNNAVVPVPEAPQGLMFYGWTADEDWQEKGLENVAISENKGLIRYDDIKDCIEGDELSVTLYPVFGEIPRHDIAIAWYNKEATSGLNETIIEGFTSNLYKYLNDNGYKTDEMDIVIRPYAGNVGPTCEAIRSDGDIDIMIGWSNAENLTGTGGMVAGKDFVENYGNILINPDFAKGARYAARISDSDTCKAVYSWILETYAGEGGPTLNYKYDPSVTPEPEPEPEPEPKPEPGEKVTVTDTTLNVSIWNNSKGAWITPEQIEKLKVDFKAHIESRVTNASEVTINWIVEQDVTNVAALVASVKAAGNIDFIVGCGNNVNSAGNLENLVKFQVPASEYMAADRYVAVLHKDAPNQLATILYEFMTGTEFKIEVTDTTLNVSIWNNSKGAWITPEQIEKLKVDFAEHLNKKVANASAVTINWIVEPDVTDVATLAASVTAAGNIDFVVGCGANVDTNTKGHLDNLIKFKVPASEYMAADRYVAVLHQDTPNQLAVMLYEFMTGSAFASV